MDFEQLREANIERNKLWDKGKKLDAQFFALGAAGEIGEVCNKVKKLVRQELGVPGSTTTVEATGTEIGDAVVYLDLLAKELGLSLEACVARAFNLKSREMNFPVFL